MTGRYLATALGGALRAELTADEVEELWQATDPDLRDGDRDGAIVLWARATDWAGRLAPLYLTPLDEAA